MNLGGTQAGINYAIGVDTAGEAATTNSYKCGALGFGAMPDVR